MESDKFSCIRNSFPVDAGQQVRAAECQPCELPDPKTEHLAQGLGQFQPGVDVQFFRCPAAESLETDFSHGSLQFLVSVACFEEHSEFKLPVKIFASIHAIMKPGLPKRVSTLLWLT